VRAFYISFFKQLVSTGTKGIMIDLLRHPPIAGYEPIVADAFKAKYGKDYREHDMFSDPLALEHQSQYLRAFLVELRKEIGKDIEISVRCRGPQAFGFKGKELIDAGLVDSIVDGNWYSGYGPRATIDETIKAVGTRGKAYAVVEGTDVNPKGWGRLEGNPSASAIAAFSKHYVGTGLDGWGTYESTVNTWYPDVRRAIRAAGWEWHK
jgi:hypothetical protein